MSEGDWTLKAFPDWTNHDLTTAFNTTNHTDNERRFLSYELDERKRKVDKLRESDQSRWIPEKKSEIKKLAKEVEDLDKFNQEISDSCKMLLKTARQDKIVQLQAEIDRFERNVYPEMDKLESEIRIIKENINVLDTNSNRALKRVKEYISWHFEQFYVPRGKVGLDIYRDCDHEREPCNCHNSHRLKEMSRGEIVEWVRSGRIDIWHIRYRYKNVLSSTFKYYKREGGYGSMVTSLDIDYELSMFDGDDAKPKVYYERR